MIEIDGNYGESGGQIVRTALALSTLTQQPFHISNIRAGRKNPGLKHQHLYGIKTLAALCNAKTHDAVLGSLSLMYAPFALAAKNLTVDIETAGSIPLLLQSVMLPCLFANRRMTLSIRGGTDVSWSPSIDYVTYVMVPQFRKFADVTIKLLRRGYYPKGNGFVEVIIAPRYHRKDFSDTASFLHHLRGVCKPVQLTAQGKMLAIKGISHASAQLQERHVAERTAQAAISFLKSHIPCGIDITSEYGETDSIGSGLTLWAAFTLTDEVDYYNPIIIGADGLGEKEKQAEVLGKEVAGQLLSEIQSGGVVDRHLADMLIPAMALLGNSAIKTSEITPHTSTNIYATEQFFGACFTKDTEQKIIRC